MLFCGEIAQVSVHNLLLTSIDVCRSLDNLLKFFTKIGKFLPKHEKILTEQDKFCVRFTARRRKIGFSFLCVYASGRQA